MSSEKESLPPIPQSPAPDAPPAYDTLAATATLLASLNDQHTDATQAIKLTDPISSPPPSTRPSGHKRTASASSTTSVKRKTSWFKFGSAAATTPTPGATSARTRAEVRATVAALVSDLVRDPSSGPVAARGILSSCAEVCATHLLSLPDILQDPTLEGHSPLYWAIVTQARRPATTRSEGTPEQGEENEWGADGDLVGALLARCPALSAEAAQELRVACVAAGDQATFQRLRARLAPAPGSDRVLLARAGAADAVTVVLGGGADGAFSATFEIPQYHTRIMVAREIALEFVARNRIWRFVLLITPDGSEAWRVPPPGSWCVSLSLQDPSPPAWLDSRLILLTGLLGDNEPALPIKSKSMLEPPRNGDLTPSPLIVPIDNTPLAGIQYIDGTSHETLRLRLDARLRRPDFM